MPTDPATSDYASLAPTSTAATSKANVLDNGNYDYFNVSDIQGGSIILGSQTVQQDYNQRATTRQTAPMQTSLVTNSPEQYQSQVSNLWTNSPSQYLAFQQQLYLAGAYGSSTPNWGAYGTEDIAAVNSALKGYLAVSGGGKNPITISDYLDRMSQAGTANGKTPSNGSGGSGGAARAPLQLTSSATLQQYANNAGQNELGRGLTTAEQGGFVNKYHGEEQAQYNGAAEAAGAPDAEATSYVDSTNNAEMQTHLQSGYAQKILSMLGVQSA